MSQAGSSVGGSSSEMRMPASTSSPPRYVTVVPSNSKPSTNEPSGASALHTSIPALRPRCRPYTNAFARKEIEHVVVEERPWIVRLEDDAESGDLARVRQQLVRQRQRGSWQIEQRREILRPRHDVPVADDVEHEDVVRERFERRRDLACPFGDDPAVEVDEPGRCRRSHAHLPKPTPRAGRELRARCPAICARDTVV